MTLESRVEKLAPMALALVSVAVVIGIGAVTLTELQDTSYTEVDVTNEQDQPSSPLPTNYTLDGSNNNNYDSIVSDSVEVQLNDSSANQNVTLSEGTDYVVYEEAGKVELKSSPGGVSYDDTSDNTFTNYTWNKQNDATGILGDGKSALDTFGNFLQVIVVVGVAAVIFAILAVLRKTGERSMA